MRKFYCKHILRTVRKSPVQPLLIVLIFAISFLILNIGLSSGFAVRQEETAKSEQEHGLADLTVTTGASSPSRFLFVKDAEKALDGITATSSFTMPFLKGGEIVGGVAVPFETVGNIFDLTFLESRAIAPGEVGKVAFVTASFAENQGLTVGDEFSLSVFGKEVSYEVAGISEYPFLGRNDVLVDISGAVALLIDDPTVYSILGAGLAPGGTLYIRVAPGRSTEEALGVLKAAFPNDNVSAVASAEKAPIVISLQAISLVLILLTVIAAFGVAFCCLFCMAKQRAECASLFSLCGVTNRQMLLLQIAEIAVYAVLGVGIGLALSLPIGEAVYRAISFRFIKFRLNPAAVLIAAAMLFFVAVITPIFFRAGKPKKTGVRKSSRTPVILLPVLLCLLFAAMFLVPGNLKYDLGIAFLVALSLTLFVVTPPLFRFFAGVFAKRAKSVPVATGFKNARRVSALANTARLILLLFTILACAFTGVYVSDSFIEKAPNYLSADYYISGGTARAAEALADVDEIGNLYSAAFTTGIATERNTSMNCWSISSPNALSSEFNITELPVGDEVIMSYATACKCGVRGGDIMTLTIGSVTKEVRVRPTVFSNLYCILFDAEAFGLSYDSYLVTARDGVSKGELFAAMTEALATETVSILPPSSVVDSLVSDSMIYVYFGKIIAAFLLLFAAVGVFDNLAESYRSRREELALFRVAGMSKKKRRSMLSAEMLYVLLFVLAVGIPVSAVALAAMRETLLSFAVEMYLLL